MKKLLATVGIATGLTFGIAGSATAQTPDQTKSSEDDNNGEMGWIGLAGLAGLLGLLGLKRHDREVTDYDRTRTDMSSRS